MQSTHARYLVGQADACVAAIRSLSTSAGYAYYAEVARQIAQARPCELREFVESYPLERALTIAPLMVLAWRIVGNEFRPELSARASEEISQLCDIDEWERAVESLVADDPA